MGRLCLVISAFALVSAVLPNPGMFVGMSLGLFASICGFYTYSRRQAPGGERLAGALAGSMAVLALLLSGSKFGLTMAAVSRLEQWFS